MSISDLKLFNNQEEITTLPESQSSESENAAFNDLKEKIQELIKTTLLSTILKENSVESDQHYEFSYENGAFKITRDREIISNIDQDLILGLFQKINRMYLESTSTKASPSISMLKEASPSTTSSVESHQSTSHPTPRPSSLISSLSFTPSSPSSSTASDSQPLLNPPALLTTLCNAFLKPQQAEISDSQSQKKTSKPKPIYPQLLGRS